MEFITAPNDYLLWVALGKPQDRSRATWRSYAEAIYDYFAWLEANALNWDAVPTRLTAKVAKSQTSRCIAIGPSTRSIGELGRHAMQPSTVRKRLSQIMRFYEWARRMDVLLSPMGCITVGRS